MFAIEEETVLISSSQSNKRALSEKKALEYISSEEFCFQEEVLADEAAELVARLTRCAVRQGDSEFLYSHGMGDLPVLGREEEASCFRCMNFLKHQLSRMQADLKSSRCSLRQVNELNRLAKEVRLIRDHLIHSNLRLVIAVVKKFVSPQFTFEELYSEGVVTLMQAVEKFDFERGFRFSTYAYRSISRALYNFALKQQQENTHYVEDSDQWVSQAVDESSSGTFADQLWRNMRDRLTELIQKLDRREQLIIRARYALSPSGKIKTFQTLADKLGVSKERVRQLEQRAVTKLQSMAASIELAR
jgi:RNA polymerase primary sigma factor